MVWADRAIDEIEKRFAAKIAKGVPLIIRDEKTLSGRVHIGSLRGIVLHGLLAQILAEKGIPCRFLFELNDFDPMDEIPKFLDRNVYGKYMGQPLFTVPAHEQGAKNYPSVFGNELQDVIARLRLPIEFYDLKPLYEGGKFNGVIKDALDKAAEIRAIYKEVSGSEKPSNWYPLQVICEKCGKVGTTQVTAWDGNSVHYMCRKDLVKWAEGCGYEGTVSPFDGRAKLPWKVEWPAKWKVMGIDIEGAGKDHSAAGGSRDIGRRITGEIFEYEEPFDVPYEFFNIGGKKMSASKGLGASAKEVSDMLPPEILKLLMIRKLPNQPIDFNPEGTTIPLLFDEFDRLADHSFGRAKEKNEEFARTFALTQIDFPAPPKDLWRMRFSLLAFLIQMPHLSLMEEAAKLKGAPLTEEEKSALQSRSAFTKKWLEDFASEEFHYRILKDIPSGLTLDNDQKCALKVLREGIAEQYAEKAWDGTALHALIHLVKAETGIEPKRLFTPLYRMFLGRESGPQMGWFLSTFPKQEVLRRLDAVVG